MSAALSTFSYDPLLAPASLRHGSPARAVEFDGRAGLNFTGIRGRLAIPDHTVGQPQGTLTLWIAPLDDIEVAPPHAHHAKSNPAFDKFALLSDRERCRRSRRRISPCIITHGGIPLHRQMVPGSYLDSCYNLRPRPTAATGHFSFRRRHWYQLALTWDRVAGDYRIYANGVLIATHDTTAAKLWDDPCGPTLYLGNPAFAFSTLDFYDRKLSAGEIRTCYRDSAKHPYADLDQELAGRYEGSGLAPWSWTPDSAWETKLNLSLRDRAHYQEFFLQGCGTAVNFTDEGFHIRTPDFNESATLGGVGSVNKFDTSKDMSRMYLWTREVFEGDLHASLEFKINAHGGLALLMTQASGMQRENFLEDYALRVNGSMATVFGEDVRNYHWEFYREMCDVRNDLVSHGLMKNPWYRPLGFQMENRRWDLGRWYRLNWLQEGARLRAAIDDVTVLDVTDSPHDNNGSIFTAGRIALRCMMRTDLVVRNLQVRNRPHYAVSEL